MTDDEIRGLVRAAIARHLGAAEAAHGAAPLNAAHGGQPAPAPLWRAHPSFGKFILARAEGDESCMIEPTVRCNHCGFCQSYGH